VHSCVGIGWGQNESGQPAYFRPDPFQHGIERAATAKPQRRGALAAGPDLAITSRDREKAFQEFQHCPRHKTLAHRIPWSPELSRRARIVSAGMRLHPLALTRSYNVFERE